MGLLSKHLNKAASTPAAAPNPSTEPTAAQLKPVEASVQPAAPAPANKPLFKKAAPATEAPKPEPVKTTPVESRALATYDPFAVITGQGSEDADHVLSLILDHAENAGGANFDGPFPVVALAKGNSGGKWVLGGNVAPEDRAVLPVAADSFTAVFLGWHLYGVAWNESKAGHQQNGADDKAKPIWKVQIGFGDKVNIQNALTAGEVYQFTKAAEKSKFDGLGHFRPGVAMVFYTVNPINGAPVVFAVKLPDHYTSTQRALENLGRVMAGLGGTRAAPLTVTPYSTDEKGAIPWKCHSVRVEAAVNKAGKDVWESFQAVKADLVADPDFSRDFKAWNQTDATPDALAALAAIAGMKN